jgi:hypothetical protein
MLKSEGNNCGPRDIGNIENQEPGSVDSFYGRRLLSSCKSQVSIYELMFDQSHKTYSVVGIRAHKILEHLNTNSLSLKA